MTLKERKRRLQRWIGVKADGVLGPKSLAQLEKVLGIASYFGKKVPRVVPRPDSVPVNGRFDARTEKNLATLQPGVVRVFRSLMSLAIKIAEENGAEIKIISGTRTWEEQDKLYAKGRTAPGKIVTKARGGYSYHNFGIAVDFGLFKNGAYLDAKDGKAATRIYRGIANEAKRVGLPIEWGGDWSFVDPPHFQYKTGLSLAQMRARVRKGEAIV